MWNKYVMLSANGRISTHHKGNPLIRSRHFGETSPDYLSRADLAREVPIRQWEDGMTKRE